MASQGRRSTGFEIVQGPAVTGQDAIREARQIRRPVEAKDLRHLQHDALGNRSEVLHQLVQRIGQRRLHVRREMGVDLGRAQALVAENLLDQSQTHAGGVQVRRVRVAQRVSRRRRI